MDYVKIGKIMKLIPLVIIAIGFVFLTAFLFASGFLSFELQKIAAYFAIAFMAFMLLFGIWAFIKGGKMQKGRIAEMKQLAEKWNFNFTEKPNSFAVFEQFLKALEVQPKQVNILKGKPKFLMTGKFENQDACVANIHYQIGKGKYTNHVNYTAVIFQTDKSFPLFVCEEKTELVGEAKLSEKYFQNQFAVTNDENFNNKYIVYGRNPNSVIPIFNPKIIDLIAQTKGLRIIGFGNYLCVFDKEPKRYSEAEIWSRMEFLDRFYKASSILEQTIIGKYSQSQSDIK